MSAGAVGKRGITGRQVLIAVVGFFVAITAIDAALIYKAVSTFGGVENKDAYRIGLAYNQRIAAEQAQNSLGWKEAVEFDRSTGSFVLTLTDKNGQGVDGLVITALIGRPATNRFDRNVELEARGSGRYVISLPSLDKGTWSVSISAKDGAQRDAAILYRSKVRLWQQS